jgi:hypothetical protein
MTGTFPLSPLVQPGMDLPADRLQALYWYLPPADKAAALRDVYFTCAAWMYAPIAADEFHEEIYAPFYGMGAPIATADDPRVAHRLSIMFMVFALGSLMDPHQAPFNVEAEKYHQLARAALFQSNIVDDPTISAVQALVRSARSRSAVRRWLTESARAVHDDVLLFPRGPTRRRVGLAVRYHGPRGQARAIGEYFSPVSEPSRSFSRLILCVLLPRSDSVSATLPSPSLSAGDLQGPALTDASFSLFAIAVSVPDRDCGRFNLPPQEKQRRRQLFWELYTYDLWQVRFAPSSPTALCLRAAPPYLRHKGCGQAPAPVRLCFVRRGSLAVLPTGLLPPFIHLPSPLR